MTEALGTKEIKEALLALAVVAKAGMLIGADGKVNFDDLKYVFELAKENAVILEGIKDAEKITAEVKDLSADEAKELLMLLFAKYAEVKAA